MTGKAACRDSGGNDWHPTYRRQGQWSSRYTLKNRTAPNLCRLPWRSSQPFLQRYTRWNWLLVTGKSTRRGSRGSRSKNGHYWPLFPRCTFRRRIVHCLMRYVYRFSKTRGAKTVAKTRFRHHSLPSASRGQNHEAANFKEICLARTEQDSESVG